MENNNMEMFMFSMFIEAKHMCLKMVQLLEIFLIIPNKTVF